MSEEEKIVKYMMEEILPSAVDEDRKWLGLTSNDPSCWSWDHFRRVRDEGRDLYYNNGHARGYVETVQKYTLGSKGMVLSPEGLDEETDLIVIESFEDWSDRVGFTYLQDEIVLRGERDGEVFIRVFPGDRFEIRFIDPGLIKRSDNAPLGILTAPNDLATIKGFVYQPGNTKTQQLLSTDEVLYFKRNADSSILRGISPLWLMRKELNAIQKLNKVRVALQAARSAIVLVREFDMTPEQAKRWVQKKLNQIEENVNNKSDREDVILKPGSILNLKPNQKLKMLNPDSGASDAEHDLRMVRLALSASSGLNEWMVGGDASNSNYASSLVAQGPATKTLKRHQTFYAAVFSGVASKWIEWKLNRRELPQSVITGRFKFSGPQVEYINKEDEVKTLIDLYESGLLSSTTVLEKLGYNPEEEKERLQTEVNND